MKIVSTGKTLASSEFYSKKQKASRKRKIIYSVSAFVILVLFILVSRLDKLRVSEIRVEGATVTGAETVSKAVHELIDGYYLWIIPRNSILFYPRVRVERALAKRFPRFAQIEVSLEGTQALVVEVLEREPFALYCREAEQCWFLDTEGFIFDSAPTFSEGVYLVYTIEPALETPLGALLLPQAEFKAIDTFVTSLNTFGFRPLAVEIGVTDVSLSLVREARVLWSRSADYARTLSNLQSFLESPTISAQGDFIQKVRQLDLRTEDKVFWKVE